ncbi:uncharacterized protein [Chelonus insularis]|uniref:uncharacterized protein n=1 Tax=Chelonus insularis TaxID=460826 RepID=UPI00158BC316|nr:uncharacterized protein LOC118074352 [Chelonus insularis]
MNSLSTKELMYIFKKIINIPDLLILREVCKKWNDVIDLLLINIKLWKNMCSKDVISPWVHEIVKNKYSSYSVADFENKTFDQSTWKEIYLFYKKWRQCVYIPSIHFFFNITSETTTDDHHEKATCMDIWADYVVVGSNIGNVNFYLLRGRYRRLYQIKNPQLFITEVKFWFTNAQKLIAVIALRNRHLKFWDVENRYNIESPSENQSSTIAECKFHRFFVASNLEILEYKYHRNRIHERQRFALSTILSSTVDQPINIIGMYIGVNKLTIVGSNFPTIVTTSLNIPVLPHRRSMIISKDVSIHKTEQFSNNKFILCHVPLNDVLLIVDDLFLYTATKDSTNQEYVWKTYQLKDPLKRNISSVLLFANTLIIGTRTGILNLYILKNVYHFSNLILETIPSRSVYLSTEPITDLKITDLKGFFHIFAMTGSMLHIVKFSENDFEQL